MVGHKRERVLGRVGRAVNAAARDFAREAAQLENGGGREAAAERLVEQQVEVVGHRCGQVTPDATNVLSGQFGWRTVARLHQMRPDATRCDQRHQMLPDDTKCSDVACPSCGGSII